jgi:phage tail-like protein
MAVAGRHDPYLAFNFLVEVEGLVIGGFSEVTGLQSEIEFYDHREGGVNEYIHKLWGPTRYTVNLILKHGLTDTDTLWRWYQGVTHGAVVRKNLSLMLLDAGGEERARWNVAGAYPVRWIGPELRAGTAAIAIETLELVHRGIEKA